MCRRNIARSFGCFATPIVATTRVYGCLPTFSQLSCGKTYCQSEAIVVERHRQNITAKTQRRYRMRLANFYLSARAAQYASCCQSAKSNLARRLCKRWQESFVKSSAQPPKTAECWLLGLIVYELI